jgi:hypothetical protein
MGRRIEDSGLRTAAQDATPALLRDLGSRADEKERGRGLRIEN